MRVKLLFLFIVLALSIEVVFITSRFLSFSDSKIKIAERISSLTNTRVEIKGKVELRFFPYPQITISHVRLYDMIVAGSTVTLRVPNLLADVSILNLFTGKIEFSDLTFDNAKIDIYDSDSQKFNIASYGKLPINEFNINDSLISFYNSEDELIKQVDHFNLFIKKRDNVTIDGNFIFNNSKYNIDGNILFTRNVVNSDIKIFSNSDSFYIDSKYEINSAAKSGKVIINGDNFQNLLFNFAPTNWFLFPDGRNYKYNADFTYNYDGSKLNILDGKITGDAISGVFSGDIQNNVGGKVIFNLDNIDFDGIITEKKKSFVMQELSQNNFYSLFSKISTNEIFLDGTIQEVNYGNVKFGPLSLNIVLDNYVKVNNIEFRLDEDNINRISGDIKNVNQNYQFYGSLSSQGKDVRKILARLTGINFATDNLNKSNFDIKSEFLLSSDEIKLTNLNGQLGSGIVTGHLNWSADDDLVSGLNLNFFNINSDDFLIYNEDNKLRHFIHYYYELLSSRQSSNSILSRFLWLRSIFSTVNFQIDFSNLTYNNVLLDVFSIKGNLKYRNLIFDEIKINSAENDININSFISIDDDENKFDVNLNINKANLAFLDYSNDQDSDNKLELWSRDYMVFPNFDNIFFTFNSNIKNLIYNNLIISEFLLKFTVRDNLLEIIDAVGKLDEDSKFNIAGEFIMDGLPQLALSYNLSNVEINNLIKFFFDVDNIKGKLYLSGSMQTYGNTSNILIKQLKSRNKYKLVNLEISPLDIGGVIQDIADMSVDPYSKFNNDLATNLFKSSTILGNSNGDLAIEKGVLLLNNLRFNIPGMNSIIAGKVDLSSKSLAINTILSFITLYRVKNDIKKMPVSVTNSIGGYFNDINSIYKIDQLEILINKLKALYTNAYDKFNEYNDQEGGQVE